MALDNPSYFSVATDDQPRPFLRTPPMRLPSMSKSLNGDIFKSPKQEEKPVYSDAISRNQYLVSNEPSRRSFRLLLRSHSANAAQDPHSILHGEPRPCDIAPPDHCAPFNPRSHRKSKHVSSKSSSISESEEHFYTMPLSGSNKRRHSIGAFLVKERSTKTLLKVTAVPSELPRVIAPKATEDGSPVTMASSGVIGKRLHPITTLHCEDPPLPMSPPPTGSFQRKKRSRCPSMKGPPSFALNLVLTSTESSLLGPTSIRSIATGSTVPPYLGVGASVLQTRAPLAPLPPPAASGILAGTKDAAHRPAGAAAAMRKAETSEMENITIVSSRDSVEAGIWVEYLFTCFNKMMSERARQHYKIISMSLEELSEMKSDNAKVKCVSKAKLQIVIICPKMLIQLEQIAEENLATFSGLHEERTLAMLLGVDDDLINDIHKRVFPSYENWQRMVMKDQDSMFVDKFLSTAVDILSKKMKAVTENANFSIIPKKIKMGQNRVIALLNEPLTNDDAMTVHVEKKGELIPIKSFKKRNPYTLQFDVPDSCLEVSMLIWIKIEKNGVSCGKRQVKCESRLGELDQILRASDNPMEFICQTLGFKTVDHDQLDNWMLSSFQKNIPPHFNLLSSPLHANPKSMATSADEYPTLLHFAARFGLERLCWQLLECPGGENACDMRNVRHLTPADLAQSHGFPEIATVLRGFVQMNEFSNMYYLLKNMSEDSPDAGDKKTKENLNVTRPNNVPKLQELPTPDIDLADPFSEECLHRLESKQTISNKIPKTPTKIPELLYENEMCNGSFVKDDSIQKAIEHDYLIQPSNRKVEPQHLTVISRPQQIDLNLNQRKPLSPNNNDHFDSRNVKVGRANFPAFSYPASPENIPVVTPTGQDELAEIIKDFKNSVFTISEVEKLVLDWQKRNETQQSLKEKQEQLNYMRKEYDRLQRQIKDSMKRPTPFERVKKIFSKGKSKSKSNNSESNATQRPNSGLSVHSISSSSSGRLSTASGASLGEAGNHSDSEDLKMFTKLTNIQDGSKLSVGRNPDFDDYLIPPPPRPLENPPFSVMPQMMKEFSSRQHMDTIKEREVFNSFNGNNYSNIAKNQFSVTDQVSEHNYINISPA